MGFFDEPIKPCEVDGIDPLLLLNLRLPTNFRFRAGSDILVLGWVLECFDEVENDDTPMNKLYLPMAEFYAGTWEFAVNRIISNI